MIFVPSYIWLSSSVHVSLSTCKEQAGHISKDIVVVRGVFVISLVCIGHKSGC